MMKLEIARVSGSEKGKGPAKVSLQGSEEAPPARKSNI